MRVMEQSLMWCVALALVALYCVPIDAVVGGDPAAPPEPDAAVVFTQRFGLSSRLEGIKDDKLGYYSFYGIRYAEPPVGPRRFQRPARKYLAGELSATKHCLPCPQRDPYVPNRIIGDEDCLCLNIYTPKMPGEEDGSPVILFIHGGNYKTGSAGPYGGQHLTQKDTILVVPQYRLGSLGYLSTGTRDVGGNVGLFDLHTVMLWIQDYIQFFGGDPKRVVVMGQGSGGSAASLMAISPEGRSATGVAALSGAPLSPGAITPDPAKHAAAIADNTGCPREPAESLIICLRKLPMQKIVQADEGINMNMIDVHKFLEEISGLSGAGARVEGQYDERSLPPLVTETPADSLKNMKKLVPMITGVTSAETSRAIFGKYNKFLTDQLQNVKDFIKKDVIGGLRGVVQGTDGLFPLVSTVQSVLPLVDYYEKLFDSTTKVADALAEVAEAAGDALFNLPAYQSVKSWSSRGPAYLYSFEHVGNLTKGWHFLPGVALAEKSNDDIPSDMPGKVKGPSHGDELAYIFEPLDEHGQPLGGHISGVDAKVRNNFVGLISKFAHNLGKLVEKNASIHFGDLLFPSGADQFLNISDEIRIDKDFRFCQIGLWGNMVDRLSGAFCTNLFGSLLNIGNLQSYLPDKLTALPGQLPGLAGQVPNLPGSGTALPGQLPGLAGQVPNLPGSGTALPGQLPGFAGQVLNLPGSGTALPGQLPGLAGQVPNLPGSGTALPGQLPGFAGQVPNLPGSGTTLPGQLPGISDQVSNVFPFPGVKPRSGRPQPTGTQNTRAPNRGTQGGLFRFPIDY